MSSNWELVWQPCGKGGEDSTLCKQIRFFPKTQNNVVVDFGRLGANRQPLRVIVRHIPSGEEIKVTFLKQYKVHFPGFARHAIENGKVKWWESRSGKGGEIKDFPTPKLFADFATKKFGPDMARQIMTAFADPK